MIDVFTSHFKFMFIHNLHNHKYVYYIIYLLENMIFEAVCLITVAVLWGGTNPIIKKNSRDITKINSSGVTNQFFLELKYLMTNINYLVPLALNQAGSVVYFVTLQSADLSLSVPVANSLTFVFTALSGWILGEELPKRNTVFGVILILIGTTLCCYDKYLTSKVVE